MYTFGAFQLEPGEETVAVAVPDRSTFWTTIGIGAAIGFCCCFIPGLAILIYGLMQREKFTNAECVVTDRRIVIIGWGGGNRFAEIRHGEVDSVTWSGGFSRSVVIQHSGGRRYKLDFVESGWEFAQKAQAAVDASVDQTFEEDDLG